MKLKLNVLKMIACILITNCHVNYPIPYLKLGGAQGNSIFFIVSGFLLVSTNGSFFKLVLKRWWRLAFPMLGITVAFVFARVGVGNLVSLGVVGFIVELVNAYWFVFAMALYYPLYYFVVKKKKKSTAIKALFVWLFFYVFLYLFALDKTRFVVEGPAFSWFKVYFYFGIFVAGGLIRFIYDAGAPKIKTFLLYRLLIFSVAFWVLEYALITVFKKGYFFQFSIQVCIFIFAVSVMCLVLWNADSLVGITKWVSGKTWVYKLVDKISSATLEVYLMQTTFKLMINKLSFPLSMVVLWGVAMVGGVLYHELLEWVKIKMRKV